MLVAALNVIIVLALTIHVITHIHTHLPEMTSGAA